MRACKWCFDMIPEETFDGFTDGSVWNGFTNIWVTAATRDSIADGYATSDDPITAAEIRALPTEANGLVSLANGYATIVV